METKVWNEAIEFDSSIKEAAQFLLNKQVVAFPTETVYGLGADATQEAAVQRIFEAKGRPSDNPLIVHVADKDQVEKLVHVIPPIARQLMDEFWPGPLTIIMESNGSAAENVTAGLSTIAIRMPDHPLALALLRTTDRPLAAPSANRSGRPSPTTAEHVFQDLNGRIAGILDGGPTGVGVESTVVDCTTEIPVILRPGGVTKEDLEQVLPEVIIDPALANEEQSPKSPGMKYTHYAPEAPLWLVDGEEDFFHDQMEELSKQGYRVGVIASDQLAAQLEHASLITCGSRDDLAQIAERLYGALREFKKADIDIILCETFPETGVGAAIMNRLTKAAVKKIKQY
ncbi:L-threonylcarbamoyladenylate synthase [Halobacillus litoralis]|uniref:Threonylcarbamoyl-AMP synthase n=1 Tax=Halobacillus litoralis TaxID=45668 RepID=A0A410MIV8_9BACI|nr:L-threonylcarbamoyladenylate synthase [Halobacillus litoralis]QAS54664.1 threonylcarbamoyl-AMP synthase [Halobacillus litoralis]